MSIADSEGKYYMKSYTYIFTHVQRLSHQANAIFKTYTQIVFYQMPRLLCFENIKPFDLHKVSIPIAFYDGEN